MIAGPFLLIGVAVVVAAAFPWAACSDCDAPLRPEISVFWVVIPLIFLFEGLSLSTAAVIAAASRCSAHIAILAFNFGAVLVMVLSCWGGLSALSTTALDSRLRDGFVALAAVPTTTSMCVMHSTAAGGNAALAAFAALLSNVCAVAVTPAILAWACSTAVVDGAALCLGLAGKMALPLLAGQLLRPHVGGLLASRAAAVAATNRGLIFCLLVQILSDIVYWGARISPLLLTLVVPTVVIMHLLAFAGAWVALRPACTGVEERVAVTYAASQKTVVLGLPLLRAVFADRTPEERALVLLPLITYHIFTLLFGLAVAPHLRALVEAQQRNTSRTGVLL